MNWEPLSIREGRRQPDGPFEDVPPHLAPHLEDWFRGVLTSASGIVDGRTVQVIALRLHVTIPGLQYRADHQLTSLVQGLRDYDGLFLDAIDMVLRLGLATEEERRLLEHLLKMGGSMWTLAADGRSLQRRVEATAQEQFTVATSPEDHASAELAEAWAKVYGRDPDPSDAWDHAIKAVETLAIPAVCPGKAKANLGSVAGDLKAQPGRWSFVLAGQNDKGIETFEAMLRLMWPNPDRHGAGEAPRQPSLEEAQAVVHLAVTLVQWLRAGALTLR